MLTRRQAGEVHSRGYATLHDVRFMSLLEGESFLDDGFLSFFDGRIATISGYALMGQPELTARAARATCTGWVTERGAESVVYLGPKPVDLGCLGRLGLRRICFMPRTRLAEELALHMGAKRPSVYRRSRRLPFQAKLLRGGKIRAEHLGLFEQFYRAKNLTPYLAKFAFALPALLSSPWIWILEARLGNELQGILLFDRPFETCIHAITLARRSDSTNVADYLLSSLVDIAEGLGVETVNLGTSPSAGHHQFKVKWGGKQHTPPFYLVIWSRGHLSRRYFDSWGPRLVGLAP